MATKTERAAEIRFSKKGRDERPSVQVILPEGTTFSQFSKVTGFLDKDLLPKLSDIVGHQACLSGADIVIRERYQDLVLPELDESVMVDLESGRVIG